MALIEGPWLRRSRYVPAPGHTSILTYLRQIGSSLSKEAFPVEETDANNADLEVELTEEELNEVRAEDEAKQWHDLLESSKTWDIEKMISVIEKQPRMMLRTVNWPTIYSPFDTVCTVFQLAVLTNSEEFVVKMLRIAYSEFGLELRQLLDAFPIWYGGPPVEVKPVDVASILGNKCLVNLLQKAGYKFRGSIDFNNIEYSPGLDGKQEVLTLIRPILEKDFEAVFQGDSCAEKWAERLRKEGKPKNTVRQVLIQFFVEYGVKYYAVKEHLPASHMPCFEPIGGEDDSFVLHWIAETFLVPDLIPFPRDQVLHTPLVFSNSQIVWAARRCTDSGKTSCVSEAKVHQS